MGNQTAKSISVVKKSIRHDNVDKLVADVSNKCAVAAIEEDFQQDDSVLKPGQRDRLAELRQLSGITRAKRVIQDTQFKFLEPIEDIKASLRLIQTNNLALKCISQKYLVATTNSARDDLATQMTALIDTTNLEANKLGPQLKQSTVVTQDLPTTKAFTIRQNICSILTRTFLDNMVEFQDLQTQFKSRYRKAARTLYAIANPNATNDELDASEKFDLKAVLEQSTVNVQRHQAKDALGYVESRHKEIVAIEKSLLELQSLFVDMAVLVAAQSEFVDRIKDNVGLAKSDIKLGVKEVQKARYYQTHKFKLSPTQLTKLIKPK